MEVVDIYNAALAQLGHDQDVSSVDDNTAVAIWCNRFYNQDRVELLRLLAPGFARAYSDLGTGNTVDDNAAWSYSFSVPSDCVRIVAVTDPSSTDDTNISFKIFQNLIYCNAESVKIEYVQDVEDTSLFDPLFTRALILKMAVDMAMPLTGQPTTRRACLQELTAAMADARNMDGQDSRETGMPSDPNWWANCRGSKSNSGYGDASGTYFPG